MDISQWVGRIFDEALGPTGGVVMISFMAGGYISLRWIAPKIYAPRIQSMDDRIEALEKEIAPYREWAASNLPRSVEATRYRGQPQ